MVGLDDIVITGLGCVTPLGIGRAAFEQSLLQQSCCIRRQLVLDDATETTFYNAAIQDFEGKLYVKPRKALKVMNREVQTAYSSSLLAWQDAGLEEAEGLNPDRLAVVYGSEMLPGEIRDIQPAVASSTIDGTPDMHIWGRQAMKDIYPLWMLKNLPNMPACHVGIAFDARGPNNTIAQEEVSGLLALNEAIGVIERDQADIAVVGAVGGRISPTRLAYRNWRLYDQHPASKGKTEDSGTSLRCRPFDRERHGIVASEAAVSFVLERRSHAVRRDARILARVASTSSRCGQPIQDYAGSSDAIASAAQSAIREAGVDVNDLSHVSAQGFAQEELDITEAVAIRDSIGNLPVTAFSSYFGTAGAACGLLELMASLVGQQHKQVLPTLGTTDVDPKCDIDVCTEGFRTDKSCFLKLSSTPFGHAAATVIECESVRV